MLGKKGLQILFAIMGGAIFYEGSPRWNGEALQATAETLGLSGPEGAAYLMAFVGAILFFFASEWLLVLARNVLRRGEQSISGIPASDLLAGVFGAITGLIASALLSPPLENVLGGWSFTLVLLTGFMGYAGFRFGLAKKEELAALWTKSPSKNRGGEAKSFEEHKILDTSVIIDGRIADICKTGFIEGTLVIPEFVLEELQHIADSSDLLKRNRGRRGLDILNKIQKELEVKVLIYEGDFEEISEVDSKLVKLAKVLQGKVITNDFNLNKVCELQGVSVLNINDLANAVKPVVLPGEEILVHVIKDGKEHGQGVAYLDDGTMIVVEGGRDFIGMTLEVMVTSVLQTSAGRMIFAKPKLLEKAL